MWKTTSLLICVVLVLVTLGIVMLASTSSVQGSTQYGDSHYYFKRQLIWLLIAGIAAVLTANIDYRYWRSLAVPLAAFSVVLLVLTLIPQVGLRVKGSSRWLSLGPVNFQPSELAKFATISMLAWWMSKIQRRAHEFKRGFLIPLSACGVILGLIFVEPDFGTTLLIGTVVMTMMFVAGTRFSYLLVSGVVLMSGFVLAVMQNATRMRRIVAFLDPEKYAQDEAFQLLNAIYAFVIGGPMGVGLGQSLQKQFYLPEAHTDFIFAIIGEELGLAASAAVLGLFMLFFLCGIRISCRAQEQFGRLLGIGITLMITLQAAINVGVVSGSLPTKGLALPFISFGGSSLLASLAMVGVLVNIARQVGDGREIDEMRSIKDAAHRL